MIEYLTKQNNDVTTVFARSENDTCNLKEPWLPCVPHSATV